MAKLKDKMEDFKRMEKKELAQLLDKKREKLFQLKFDLVSGKVKNIREIRETRRDIARILFLSKKI